MVDDTRPIWVQLTEDFRRLVVTGVWSPGQRIPSVRELATQLGVNPNTVQRALGELDRTKVTVTERTAGRFVTRDAELLGALRDELAAAATDDFVAAMKALGCDQHTAVAQVARRWNEGDRQ